MISLLAAANDNAAAVAALNSMPLSAAQIGANLFIGNNGGQRLPLTSAYSGDRSAVSSLGSARHPAAGYGEFRLDAGQHSLLSAFAPSNEMNAMTSGNDEDDKHTKYKSSVDEMDDDDYLSIPGDEKFAAFRQMAISGKMANKVCRVCGDRALGYNFNVVSCESCKAFFRRNALKKKEFRCPFNDNCDVTALSRRFCQKCRLRKCFEVGMKKEWIMSEEQRLQKRKRIEENRQKRRVVTEKGVKAGNDEGLTDEPSSTEEPPSSVNNAKPDQKHMTNAGFSPGSNPSTPVAASYGNDFSPPDSTGPSHAEYKRGVDGQTVINTSANGISAADHRSIVSSHDRYDGYGMRTKLENAGLIACAGIKSRGMNLDDRNAPSFVDSSPEQFLNSLELRFGLDELRMDAAIGGQQSSESDESVITIPKGVLINLINQCHRKQRESNDVSSMAGPTPVVVRAHRLFTDVVRNDSELYKCICRCTCGAKLAGSSIGPKLVDRGLGPDGDEYEEKKDDKQLEVHGHNEISCCTATADTSTTDMEIADVHRSPVTRHSESFRLTILEEYKLRELLYANQVMHEDIDGEGGPDSRSGSASSLSSDDHIVGQSNGADAPAIDPADVIRLTDICVRRIIKMCKRLSAFRSLCQDDQIALLKGGCTELMIMRGVMTFIPAKECWRPVGWKNSLLSLDVMKGVKGNVYEEHKKYLHSFRDEWRTCDPIMLCLAAITLFNPERPNIIHVEAVREEQELYIGLLKRYVDIMYGFGTMASQEAFQELLNRVTAVGRLNDYAATIFVDVNPRDVEPLLIEIFDLK